MSDVSPAARLAVLITNDQFPLAALGCYGNDWVDTTALDTLAAEGFVLDRCLANRIDETPQATAESLATALQEIARQGVRLVVVEEAGLPSLAATLPGAEFRTCPAGRIPPESATDLPFMSLLNSGRELAIELAAIPQPTLLWLRCAGVPPDAIPPADAFELYADELTEISTGDSESDDEALIEHPALRAAYVSLLDYQLGEFCTSLRELACPVLVQWTAFQSWPWVSATRQASVWGELDAARIHVPWVVWEHRPGAETVSWEPGRSAALVQTADLPDTLTDWLISQVSRTEFGGIWPLIVSGKSELRDFAVTYGLQGAVSVWTPQDQVVFASLPQSDLSELPAAQRYWQPEDAWNIFDTSGDARPRLAEVAKFLATSPTPNPSST